MKLKGLRWWVITLIFIATVINYIDRTAFALLWPEMGEDLGMDNSDYALMLNIFMLTYAASKFLSGRLYDKIGTRIGFVLSIVVWSAAAAFHAVARGVATLSIARGLLGLGEAGLWPGAVKSNGEWFPVKQRALAQGIFNSGASIGNVIAPVVIVYLYSQFGWKSTYIILGAVGLLWVIPWLIINKSSPKDHPWITDEERNMLLNDRIENNNVVDENAKSLSVAKILSFKQPWGVLLCRFYFLNVIKEKLILNNKSCHLDPVPTYIMKDCLDVLLPSLTKMVNLSMTSSTFPSAWKKASVTPLLKKASLEVEEMKNYRPVSNLPYISKIVEKTVLKKLISLH